MSTHVIFPVVSRFSGSMLFPIGMSLHNTSVSTFCNDIVQASSFSLLISLPSIPGEKSKTVTLEVMLIAFCNFCPRVKTCDDCVDGVYLQTDPGGGDQQVQ